MIRHCNHCGTKNRIPARHLADLGKCGKCGESLPPVAEPIEAEGAIFDDVTRAATVPVLVDFWAPWCGPCRSVAPEVARAAANLAGRAIVLKVNTEDRPELAARFNVRSIPNFAVFSGGRLTRQQAGAIGHRQLEDFTLGRS